MTQFVVDRVKGNFRSVWNKGNGVVTTTDYESITVTLDTEVTAEEGTIVFTDPGTLNANDVIEINIGFNDLKKINRKGGDNNPCCYDCEITGCLHIQIPDPVPDDVAAFISDTFRRYSMFLANTTATYDEATATITYKALRAGWEIVIESDTDGVLTQTKTVTPVAGGLLPSIGAGSALFIKPERNRMTIPSPTIANLHSPGMIRPILAATGYASADPVPCFFGVLREKYQWQDPQDLGCCIPIHDCPEAVRKGTIQIPLEQKAPDTYPECPTVAARYAPDGTFSSTGGFRILGAADALPAGMTAVSRGEIMMIHPDGMSAILKLH